MIWTPWKTYDRKSMNTIFSLTHVSTWIQECMYTWTHASKSLWPDGYVRFDNANTTAFYSTCLGKILSKLKYNNLLSVISTKVIFTYNLNIKTKKQKFSWKLGVFEYWCHPIRCKLKIIVKLLSKQKTLTYRLVS